MLRLVEDCVDRPPPDDAAEVHDEHVVGHLGDNPALCVMSMIATLLSAWRRRSRSRICAWVVTSSAVVGSSAINNRGPQASAIASVTRWRNPRSAGADIRPIAARRGGFPRG
jgi:hypothetical protein